MSVGEDPTMRTGERICGIHCVFISLLQCGIEPGSLPSLISQIGPADDPSGYSVGDLMELLRRKGAYCIACKSDLEKIASVPRNGALIAHLRRSHFVVVQSIGDDDVEYIDQAQVISMPRRTFEKQCSGVFILASRDPVTLPSSQWFVEHRLAIAVFVAICGASTVAGVLRFRRRNANRDHI